MGIDSPCPSFYNLKFTDLFGDSDHKSSMTNYSTLIDSILSEYLIAFFSVYLPLLDVKYESYLGCKSMFRNGSAFWMPKAGCAS